MSGQGGGGTFNIGSQQAGAIYQAGRDQVIHDTSGSLSIGVLNAMSDLRVALATAEIPASQRPAAEAALDEVETELKQPAPDKQRVAHQLEAVAGVLSRAGALAGAVDSLRKLAGWLGPAGLTLVKLLA